MQRGPGSTWEFTGRIDGTQQSSYTQVMVDDSKRTQIKIRNRKKPIGWGPGEFQAQASGCPSQGNHGQNFLPEPIRGIHTQPTQEAHSRLGVLRILLGVGHIDMLAAHVADLSLQPLRQVTPASPMA